MLNALRGFLMIAVGCVSLPALAGQGDDPPPPVPPQQGNAQNPGQGPGGGPGRGFGRGFRDFMRGGAADFEAVKAKIRASDEEWKVIGPKLQKVMIARQAADTRVALDAGLQAPGGAGPDQARRGGGRGGPPSNDAFRGPSTKASGDFGPGGGPPQGMGPGGGAPPFGPDGGPPPGFGPDGGPPPGVGQGGPPAGFGPGGGPPPGFGGPENAVTQAMGTLRTTLADTKATPQEVQEKVAAVRAARQRARQELAEAQKDLLELLTADQEATLVGLGYMD